MSPWNFCDCKVQNEIIYCIVLEHGSTYIQSTHARINATHKGLDRASTKYVYIGNTLVCRVFDRKDNSVSANHA